MKWSGEDKPDQLQINSGSLEPSELYILNTAWVKIIESGERVVNKRAFYSVNKFHESASVNLLIGRCFSEAGWTLPNPSVKTR